MTHLCTLLDQIQRALLCLEALYTFPSHEIRKCHANLKTGLDTCPLKHLRSVGIVTKLGGVQDKRNGNAISFQAHTIRFQLASNVQSYAQIIWRSFLTLYRLPINLVYKSVHYHPRFFYQSHENTGDSRMGGEKEITLLSILVFDVLVFCCLFIFAKLFRLWAQIWNQIWDDARRTHIR